MKTLVMPYTESGITIDLSGLEYFCFENCEGYRKLSGSHFREMDIGWYENSEDTLYLVELKDFTFKNLGNTNIMNEVVSDLVKKSIDSISMIIAVKAGTPYSSNIRSCLPPSFNTSTSLIKIVHIINCSPSKVPYISGIRSQVREQFEPYQKLFGVAHCTVVSVEQAKKFLSPIK